MLGHFTGSCLSASSRSLVSVTVGATDAGVGSTGSGSGSTYHRLALMASIMDALPVFVKLSRT